MARLVEGGSIAGSTLTMDTAFKRAVTVDRLSLADAVRALSANPARLLGLSDRIGSLEPGKDADLVVLDEAYDVVGRDAQGRVGGPPVLNRPCFLQPSLAGRSRRSGARGTARTATTTRTSPPAGVPGRSSRQGR